MFIFLPVCQKRQARQASRLEMLMVTTSKLT
jgi:hypothetical protein